MAATSRITALVENYRNQIETYTKEFEKLTVNPATPTNEELQYKWGVVFNILKEVISEYKGILMAMKAMDVPVDADDEQLIKVEQPRAASVSDENVVKYDEDFMKLSLNGRSGMGGLIIPPQ